MVADKRHAWKRNPLVVCLRASLNLISMKSKKNVIMGTVCALHGRQFTMYLTFTACLVEKIILQHVRALTVKALM